MLWTSTTSRWDWLEIGFGRRVRGGHTPQTRGAACRRGLGHRPQLANCRETAKNCLDPGLLGASEGSRSSANRGEPTSLSATGSHRK
jgi:hypothetical protein